MELYIYMLRLEFKYTGDSDYTFGGSAQWNAQDNTWQFACGRVPAAACRRSAITPMSALC